VALHVADATSELLTRGKLKPRNKRQAQLFNPGNSVSMLRFKRQFDLPALDGVSQIFKTVYRSSFLDAIDKTQVAFIAVPVDKYNRQQMESGKK
jgi:hypothetical protein